MRPARPARMPHPDSPGRTRAARRTLGVTLAAGLLAGPALAAPAQAGAEPTLEYLVVSTAPTTVASGEADVPVVAARLTRAAAAALDARDDLVVEPVLPVVLETERVVTGGSWGLDRIDQRDAALDARYRYPAEAAGQAVTAYVLDTGISPTHVEFGTRVRPGYSAVADGRGTDDCHGHGTHVAGLLGGATAGVAPEVDLVPARVFGCTGSTTTAVIAEAADWVVDDHEAGVPAVANLSLGGGASAAMDAVVGALLADGITVVVAAGNEATDACLRSPARAPDVITVGATAASDARASFSNHGTCVDLFAPGQALRSASPASTTAYVLMSGTSMASPIVAGVAARYLSQQPGASPAQVTEAVLGAATTGAVTDARAGSPDALLFADPAGFAAAPPEPSVPAAPAHVAAASAATGALTATWTLPADPGPDADADAATRFTVTAVPAAGTSVAPAARTVPADGPLTTTFRGLTAGARYAVRVVAANAAGSGAATTSATVRVIAPATPVRSLTARSSTAGTTRSTLRLSWTAPADLGGAALLRYEVRLSGGAWVSTGTATGRTVTGLPRGTRVPVDVRAVTAAGAGASTRTTVTTAR